MRKLPTWLTENERDKMLSLDTSKRNRAILTTFIYAGLRSNELRMLNVEDFDFEAMTLHVRHAKGDKERYIPLHPQVVATVSDYLDGREAGAVFAGRAGRISNRHLRTLVKQFGQAAMLRKSIHPHALRHTFAVSLLENGESLEVIRDLLGHEDIRTTIIYLHCSMAGKRSAINRL